MFKWSARLLYESRTRVGWTNTSDILGVLGLVRSQSIRPREVNLQLVSIFNALYFHVKSHPRGGTPGIGSPVEDTP